MAPVAPLDHDSPRRHLGIHQRLRAAFAGLFSTRNATPMLVSFAVHGILLAALGLAVFHLPKESSEGLFTISSGEGLGLVAGGGGFELQGSLDLELPNPAAAGQVDALAAPAVSAVSELTALTGSAVVGAAGGGGPDLGTGGGSGGGNGTGIGGGDGPGVGIYSEPGNAVRAGSFAVFTVPVAAKGQKEPEAGTPPAENQDYYIVIQIRVPRTRTSYLLSDLSGEIIGTDSYRQTIPSKAYYRNEKGKIVSLASTRKLKVNDGLVQIMIRVPGAPALIRDSITVRSKLLREEQFLQLVFGLQ